MSNYAIILGVDKYKYTRCIVLHHADAQSFSVYQCHACHLTNGWSGIGYQYYITKDGTIWKS